MQETRQYHQSPIGTQTMGAHHSDQIREPYDIYNCPDDPPEGYPFEWKLVDEVLNNWPVNDIDHVPLKIHQGVCVFDFHRSAYGRHFDFGGICHDRFGANGGSACPK